jgi:hypothetical protein
MANPFERMAERMDAATVTTMGKTASINGVDYDVVPAELFEEMGPLAGTGTALVVFSPTYKPARNDTVVFDEREWIVTRYQPFNGKPRIWLE